MSYFQGLTMQIAWKNWPRRNWTCFHAKMNRYLYEAAHQNNVRNKYQRVPDHEMARRSKKRRRWEKATNPTCIYDATAALVRQGRRYRTLEVKWAIGIFPPMSNSLLREKAREMRTGSIQNYPRTSKPGCTHDARKRGIEATHR